MDEPSSVMFEIRAACAGSSCIKWQYWYYNIGERTRRTEGESFTWRGKARELM